MSTLAEHVENYLTAPAGARVQARRRGRAARRVRRVRRAGWAAHGHDRVRACSGRGGRQAAATTISPGGCGRSARSRGICTRSTPPARSRRSSCCPRKQVPASAIRLSDEEIVALMAAAGALRPPFRAATFRTLIGLLACTGLRIGEALRLDRDDVDLADGVLTVRDSKFGKSREVLLHPSTVRALLEYGEIRDRLCPQPKHARASSSPRAGPGPPPHDLPAVPRAAGAGRRSRTHRQAATFGFTICAILCCQDAAGLVSRRRRRRAPGCRCCPRIWGMSTRPRRSGTCPQHRSCSRSPPSDSSRLRRTAMTALAPTLEAFFTSRLINEKGVSPHTIAAYRDTFRLLLTFAQQRTGKQPSNARARGSRRSADHARSSITSSTTAATAPEPATPGWRRSTRCSATPRCATPSTPR